MSKNIEDAIKEAAKMAELVPEDLREAAFNRALDAILNTNSGADPKGKTRNKTKVSRRKESQIDSTDPVNILLEHLDRTAHSEIAKAPKVLERALFLLRAARDDLDIDGLNSPQIAKVLTEKFRIRTSRQAVTAALDVAGDKVDLQKISNSVQYRLMQPGDDYLDSGDFSNPAKKSSPKKPKVTTKKSVGKKTKVNNKPSAKKAPKSGRPGPGEMLKFLAADGFFEKSRSINDIKIHCEKNLAHKYSLQDFSTPLRRAVHNGLLKREENTEGQYEYKAKN